MDNTKNKIVEIENKSYLLLGITPMMLDDADRVEKITYSKALRDGALTSEEVLKIARERNIVTDEADKKYQEGILELAEIESKLDNDTLTEKKQVELCMEISRKRNELIGHNSSIYEMIENTAESMGRSEAESFLAVQIICNNSGERLFDSVDMLRKQMVNPDTVQLFNEAILFIKGLGNDFYKDFPETEKMESAGYEFDSITHVWEKKIEDKVEDKTEDKIEDKTEDKIEDAQEDKPKKTKRGRPKKTA